MKFLRHGFSATPRLYLVILLTHILFEYDLKHWNVSETFPINYLLVSIFFTKLYELWLKMSFVFIYIAPFQISWGSAFHAVAQLAFLPRILLILDFFLLFHVRFDNCCPIIACRFDVFVDPVCPFQHFVSTLGTVSCQCYLPIIVCKTDEILGTEIQVRLYQIISTYFLCLFDMQLYILKSPNIYVRCEKYWSGTLV